MAAADAARARSQAIQQGIEGVASTAQQGLSMVPLYQKQGAGARQAALTSTGFDAETLKKANLTQADLDTVGAMGRRDFKAFEKSLTPQQRGLLFNADYYANLMPGGMDAFYNIGSGTTVTGR
jgi:hypothetical protein